MVSSQAVPKQSGASARRIADKMKNTKIKISPKVLLQLFLNYVCTLDIFLTVFFKSLKESAKRQQKILCGQTDQSKYLV